MLGRDRPRLSRRQAAGLNAPLIGTNPDCRGGPTRIILTDEMLLGAVVCVPLPGPCSPTRARRAVALVRAGARGYLCKRAGGRDLVMAVRALSRGELALSAHILQAVVNQLARHTPGTVGEDDLSREVLSARELEVLGLLCQGRTDKEIAQQLYLSVRTVNSHVSHIYAKLGVGTRTEAMELALRCGLVSLSASTRTAEHR